MVGGMGSLWGPLAAAFLLTALPESLRVTDTLSALIYGLVLLLVILFAPRGIAGVVTDAGKLARRIRAVLDDQPRELAGRTR